MTDTAVRLTIDGRVCHVHVSHPEDREAVRSALSGFEPAASAPSPDVHCSVVRTGALWTVETTGRAPQQASTLGDALLAVEWQLVTDVLAHQAHRFHLHGAALADPTGSMTVLVLGESGVGKTTLTLALIAAGFRPYTDDVVLLDVETMTVERFPRAFHVDANTRRLMAPFFANRRWEVAGLPAGNCLPIEWASVPTPVGAIVFPKSRDHASPFLQALTVAEAAMTLLSFTTTIESAPELALQATARLTASAPSYALYGGSVAANADVVASTVRGLRANRRAGG